MKESHLSRPFGPKKVILALSICTRVLLCDIQAMEQDDPSQNKDITKMENSTSNLKNLNSLPRDLVKEMLRYFNTTKDKLNFLSTSKYFRSVIQNGIESPILQSIKQEFLASFLIPLIQAAKNDEMNPEAISKLNEYFDLLQIVVNEMMLKENNPYRLRELARAIVLTEIKRSNIGFLYSCRLIDIELHSKGFAPKDINDDLERTGLRTPWMDFYNNARYTYGNFCLVMNGFNKQTKKMINIPSYCLRTNSNYQLLLEEQTKIINMLLSNEIVQSELNNCLKKNDKINAHKILEYILQLKDLAFSTNRNDIIQSIQEAIELMKNQDLTQEDQFRYVKNYEDLIQQIQSRRFVHNKPTNYIYLERGWEIIKSVLAKAQELE